ncbi:hypothetical protein ABZ485_15910 [Streptomyces albogriseolus]|uniref:hypothetical protein n=1 Tax=Streptomyces albogriseolus TaxID=1887 RepID=UPI0034617863
MTGKKYGEVWDSKGQRDRREFLRTYDVKVWAWNNGQDQSERGMVMDLGDIQAMADELALARPAGKGGTARMVIGCNVSEDHRSKVLGFAR